MQEAAECFVGVHDFRRFAAPLEKENASSVRYVCSASVEKAGNLITFDVEGSSFLRHQVRRMAGAIIDAGRHKLSVNDLNIMIEGGETEAVAHSSGPQGLCLMNVTYADFPPKVGESDDNRF
jgi:tRNA pseudouridine38-40 synthase